MEQRNAAGADGGEMLGEIFAGLKTYGRIFREAFQYGLLEFGGNRWVQSSRRNRLGVNDFVGDGGDGFSREWLIAGG